MLGTDYKGFWVTQFKILFFQCFVHSSAVLALTKDVQTHLQNLKGLEMEKHFYDRLKDLLTTVRASNVTVISGLEGKEGKTTTFELDFLIIVGNSKTIIQVEAKAGLNEKQKKKVEEQFHNGLSFFKRTGRFKPGDGWRYLKVIFTQVVSPNTNICDCCKQFILDSSSNLENWWKFIAAGE